AVDGGGAPRDRSRRLSRAGLPRAAHRLGAMPSRTLLTPGVVGPPRPVPADIPRPEYVGRPGPTKSNDPWVQPPEIIEKMRIAGRIAAEALAAGGAAVRPGVTTDEIDRVVHECLLDHHAYPSTLGYKGFPKSCCTSLN